MAYRTLDAAHDHDPIRVGANTLQLYVALTDHVIAERPAFLQLPPGSARLLERGQHRIVDLVRLLADSAVEGTDGCGCDRIADTLVVELELQAADERRYLHAAAG
ncbi:MAG TPA: hypothetical protein VFP54_05170 [Acidimicrobiales bacterium]|nr:hypothetical protein [Acidimicrobiales bacterium]